MTVASIHLTVSPKGLTNAPAFTWLRARQRKTLAGIASGFANNTTLRDLDLDSWGEADLVLVSAALQRHSVLKKIHFNAYCDYLPSLSGLEDLLRSQDSKVKELIFEGVDRRTVDFYPVMRELGRNATITTLTIRESVLNHESVQQLRAMLCQKTALQHLSLFNNRLKSAGLTEIASGLYRNTSIKSLDLSFYGLNDIESANVLCQLIHCNKTITSLCLPENTFGRKSTAARFFPNFSAVIKL
jgi:hypothetical protein